MIMQLIEDGKITLDTKLAKFFPKVPNAEIITIGQMLNHHSGIKTFTSGSAFKKLSRSTQAAETIIGMIEGHDSAFAPGLKGDYSNSNFYLLGHIIEQVTGHSYQDNLSSRITDKLGLQNTYYGGKITRENNEVSSYSWRKDKWRKETETNTSVLFSAGAIVSTTADLNRFIYALFEEELLTKDSISSMLEIEDGFGKAIFRKKIAGVESFGHNGKIDGFHSKLSYLPSAGIGIAILSNGLQTNRKDIVAALLSASRGKLVKLPVILTESQFMAFSGHYQNPDFPRDITIFEKNGTLMVQATGKKAFSLTPTSENRFKYVSANIFFQFDSEKNQMIFSQKGRDILFTKPLLVILPEEQLKTFIGHYQAPSFSRDITVFVKNGILMAQATGQSAFPLTFTSESRFSYVPENIVFQFDSAKKQMLFSQKGRDTLFTLLQI